MHFKYYFTLLILTVVLTVKGQNTSILKGVVNTEEGIPIVGANITIKSLNKGAVSDINGNYILKSLTKKTYSVEASYLGFKSVLKTVQITEDNTQLNFVLEEDNFMLEGIVVTAQKREQKNKEVPIAITSYGNSFIENQGAYEYDVLSDFVPGLQVQIQSVNNPGIVIRGITSDSGDSRVEPRVSVFQDGVSISKSRGSVVELFDLERVEVLKGPQGTLFGRGAQIGAIHIIQNKAKNEMSGSLKFGYGNFNQTLVTGHFNAPLLVDKLFFRVAAIYNARDGFIENISGGNLNGKKTLAFRTSFKYLISDNTKLDVILNWQNDTPPGTSFKSKSYAPLGGDISPYTFADFERGEELGVDRTVYGVTAILNHRFNDMWDLTSTTAYRTFDSNEAFDADGTAAPALFFSEIAKGKQFSQELRFSFEKNEKFRGFFGGNFFAEDGSQSVDWEVNEQSFAMLLISPSTLQVSGVPMYLTTIPNLPSVFGPIAGAPLAESNKESYANYGNNYSGDVFADASYDITDKFSFTLGLRATLENINAGYEVEDATTPSYIGYLTGAYPNNLFVSTNNERIKKSDNFLSLVGRFALNYEINDNITLFGTTARGRRPNVINISASETTILSDEIVWSYEIGAKSLFLNNTLQFDVNAYIYDYSNFQTSVTKFIEGEFTSTTEDSGNASSFGFEAALQYAASKKISFFANYSYIDASFDDENSDGAPQELAGNTFRLTPKHSISAGFNFNPNISDKVGFFLRPSFTYKSKVYFEETNLEDISQAGYGIMNVRTGITIDKKYEINLYMNNIFDKEYIIDAGNTGETFGIPTFIAGAPKFYGMQVAVKF